MGYRQGWLSRGHGGGLGRIGTATNWAPREVHVDLSQELISDWTYQKFHDVATWVFENTGSRASPLKAKDAATVRQAFARKLRTLPTQLRRSLTYDQGPEMREHRLFTKQTKMGVYFAHPPSPSERGTNENTNGLLRQFFPKGTQFQQRSRAEIKRVQAMLNDRPRKILNWHIPAHAFYHLLH